MVGLAVGTGSDGACNWVKSKAVLHWAVLGLERPCGGSGTLRLIDE